MESPNSFMLVTPEEDAELTLIMQEEVKATKSARLGLPLHTVGKGIHPEGEETLQKESQNEWILNNFCKHMHFCTKLGNYGVPHNMRSMRNCYFQGHNYEGIKEF